MPQLTRGSSSPNSPGIFGALKDAIRATADYAAKSAVGRAGVSRRDQQIAEATGDQETLQRMRHAQSTDRHN